MNQLFDFKRWMLLVAKHWSENRKKYLLSLVAIVALMVIWYSFIMLVEQNDPFPEEIQLATYYIGMALIGCLFGSLLFADIAGGPKAMHHMSVPASTLEKLLCGLLYGVVIFFICYTAIFYLVDFIMINVSNSIQVNYWKTRDPEHVVKIYKVVNMFKSSNPEADMPINYFFMLIYFNLQIAFILGSVYFPSYSFIKTCITLLVVFLVFVFLLVNVMDGFLPRGHYVDGFTTYRVMENRPVVRAASLPEWFAYTVNFLFKYGFILLFLSATYFRLKEKEV